MLMHAAIVNGQAVKTQVVQSDGKWQLLRDGQPYLIKGAGGGASKKLLKEIGGNSFRTWGTDNLERQLDEAQQLGMTVCVGIWLGQERSGFSYDSEEQVTRQFESARKAIEKYKGHPAVLLWAVGNESGLLWIYDTQGQQVLQRTSTASIDLIRWSPDGQWMAAGKDLWKVDSTKFVLKNYLKGLNGSLDWSPDSRYIASAGSNVVYIQQADGKLITILKGHTDQVNTLAWSPKGNILASGAADHTIRLWDVANLP